MTVYNGNSFTALSRSQFSKEMDKLNNGIYYDR